jgi:hypothetical protein
MSYNKLDVPVFLMSFSSAFGSFGNQLTTCEL